MPKLGISFQIQFFPQFWGENGVVPSMSLQVIQDSLFSRLGSGPFSGRGKRESRNRTRRGKRESWNRTTPLH